MEASRRLIGSPRHRLSTQCRRFSSEEPLFVRVHRTTTHGLSHPSSQCTERLSVVTIPSACGRLPRFRQVIFAQASNLLEADTNVTAARSVHAEEVISERKFWLRRHRAVTSRFDRKGSRQSCFERMRHRFGARNRFVSPERFMKQKCSILFWSGPQCGVCLPCIRQLHSLFFRLVSKAKFEHQHCKRRTLYVSISLELIQSRKLKSILLLLESWRRTLLRTMNLDVLDTRCTSFPTRRKRLYGRKGEASTGLHSIPIARAQTSSSPDFTLGPLHAGRSCQTRAALQNVEIDNNRRLSPGC